MPLLPIRLKVVGSPCLYGESISRFVITVIIGGLSIYREFYNPFFKNQFTTEESQNLARLFKFQPRIPRK